MDKKKTVLLIALLCVAAALLAVLLVLRGGLSEETQAASRFERTADGAIIIPQSTAGPVPTAKTADAADPAASAGAAAAPNVNAFVPSKASPASSAYFADAAFVGNETVAALKRYDYDGLLTEAAFYEVETVTDTSYVRKIKDDGGYGKIYIGLGGYELAYRVDDLRDSLSSAISALKEEYPDCIIYLMSVSPVSKYRESVSRALRMDRLPEYNDMLLELAGEKGVWYIEITSALVDEEGYLPSEVTEDGINYTPGHYAGWYERIATHYIGESK